MIKILLVDDEKAFLDTITKRLEKRDMVVQAAYSGKDALAALEENQSVEVVILDVKMPEMDGIQTLVEIKKKIPPGGGDHADRACHRGIRHRRDETGGFRLPDEALRY
jgi:CheY-like chemotaxis protein